MVWNLHQEEPHIVIRPILDRRIYMGVGQIAIGTDAILKPELFIFTHYSRPGKALRFPRTQDQ